MIILFFIFLPKSEIVLQNILQKSYSTPTKKYRTSISYKNSSPLRVHLLIKFKIVWKQKVKKQKAPSLI